MPFPVSDEVPIMRQQVPIRAVPRHPVAASLRAKCSLGTAPYLLALALAGLSLTVLAPPAAAQAPPAADRSEIEEKKRQQEERERRKREAEVKETSEQRESRERIEKRDGNVKEALKKAQAALTAANARQNQKAMQLMEAAWSLDPMTIDYPYNAALLAEALQNVDVEFRAHSAVQILAKRALPSLGPDAPARAKFEERLAKAIDRLDFLKTKLSTGTLILQSDPKNCDLYLDGAFVGQGSGTIDAVTGQRKAEAQCPGFHDHFKFVNVRIGDPSTEVLKPLPIAYFGKLVVKVEPADGVTVYLDDQAAGERTAEKPSKDGKIAGKGTKQEPFELSSRKWVLRFEKEGFDRWHRRIDVPREQTLVIEARLEPLNETIEPADKPSPRPPVDSKPK